jgi:hypothetical protein
MSIYDAILTLLTSPGMMGSVVVGAIIAAGAGGALKKRPAPVEAPMPAARVVRR